tara:strand:- start:156 stop:356 length:201 start_codon:yes stop_codon:yes gene_type:complete
MGKVERRYQVSLTKSEIESLVCILQVSAGSRNSPFIQRFERRLRQIQSHEEMESRLSLDPEIQVGI